MTNPLGNNASYLTPPHDPTPKGEREGSFPEAEKRLWLRRTKWHLRQIAGRLLPKPESVEGERWHADGFPVETLGRVAGCGRKLVGSTATVVVDGQGRARYLNVETCGSVWLCPCCSAKIGEHRRAEIEAIITAHTEGRRRRRVPPAEAFAMATWEAVTVDPGHVYMATFTTPHTRWDGLRRLREGVAVAWGKLINGSPWKRACERWGISGVIRAMEVTHGRNGWHPHLHVLLLTGQLDEADADEMRVWLAERWAVILQRMGLATEDNAADVIAYGVEMHRAERATEAGDYIGKWGCDEELTKWHVKAARRGNRSPWQLLAAAGEGEVEARIAWREFASVFAGTRHLTMSHGLRDRYLDGAEMTDLEICAMEHGVDPAELVQSTGEVIVGRLRRGLWVRVIRAGMAVDVLEAVEAGGWEAALCLLADKGLALRREA